MCVLGYPRRTYMSTWFCYAKLSPTSVRPRRQRRKNRGGAPTSDISPAARSSVMSTTLMCSAHQSALIGVLDKPGRSPEVACRQQWRTTVVARCYAGVLRPPYAPVRCSIAMWQPIRSNLGGYGSGDVTTSLVHVRGHTAMHGARRCSCCSG